MKKIQKQFNWFFLYKKKSCFLTLISRPNFLKILILGLDCTTIYSWLLKLTKYWDISFSIVNIACKFRGRGPFGDIHIHLVVRIFLEAILNFLQFRIKTHIFSKLSWTKTFFCFMKILWLFPASWYFIRYLPEWLLGGLIHFNINMQSIQHC